MVYNFSLNERVVNGMYHIHNVIDDALRKYFILSSSTKITNSFL